MSLFVSADPCPPEALQALIEDGILVESEAGSVAPAHDVLEDWAVARFVEQEFEAKAHRATDFFDAVGPEPAMRRGFRLWLSEALAPPHSQRVMDFVLTAFQQRDISSVWRDEVAVAVLQSENAGEFIQRTERLLLGEGKALYLRLVQILRTACKGPNESLLRTWGLDTLLGHTALSTVFVVPIGPGWAELIQLTYRNLDSFSLNEASTVLALLKDWVQKVRGDAELPPESTAAANVCLRYWHLLTAPGVYASGLELEFLQVLFKIPNAAAADVQRLVRAAVKTATRDYHSRYLLEHVTMSIECEPLCRHFPGLVIEVAERTWRQESDRKDAFARRLHLEEYFGLARSLDFAFFPASALQGPFTFLLYGHPDKGVDFVVRLANYAADCYSRSELGGEAILLKLSTGTALRPLLCSARLWGLHRGLSTGPHVLESALMALEGWLLDRAKREHNIAELFQGVLDQSTSASIIAVLVSVATAYPQAVGEKVLPLLTVRPFYRWDFERSYAERSLSTDLRSAHGIPTGGLEDIYYDERKRSAALPHRTSNLEQLVFRLQFTPLRDEVRHIIDRFRDSLPPPEDQTEDDKTWRIALHRMDARNFSVGAGEGQGQIVLTPTEPSPDLQRFIDKSAATLAPQNRRLRLAWWGRVKFRGEPPSPDPFPDWREAYAEAQALWGEPQTETESTALGMSDPVFVAAHLIRDRYAELNSTEAAWCRAIIVREVLQKDAETVRNDRYSRNSFDGSRPAAAVLPLLLQHGESQARSEIEACLAVAVTHSSEEVRDYVAEGVRTWLWVIDPSLAKACVGSLIALAGAENAIRRKHRRSEDYSRDTEEQELRAATRDIRLRIQSRQVAAVLTSPQIDLETHDWPELLDALAMVPPDTADADLIEHFATTLSATLREAEAAEAWKSGRQATHEFQYPFAALFARFLLARTATEATRFTQTLTACIDKSPRCLALLLEHIVREEVRVDSGATFWAVWSNIAAPVFGHGILRTGSRYLWRYSETCKLVRVLLFADVEWKKEVKEGLALTANRDRLEWAASTVAGTRAGFGAFVSLLNAVGGVFLPDAILWLGRAGESAKGVDLLEDSGVDFSLEILLRKVAYNFGADVRRRPELHRAVLELLDRLVERGSHTGFRLRDFMIAPVPPGN